MEFCNSPDIFQGKISKLFKGFDMVRLYIYYVLVINKNNFKDHLKDLDRVLQILAEAGLEVNALKSLFVKTESGYLSFWVRKNGVTTLYYKLESIKSIDVPNKA